MKRAILILGVVVLFIISVIGIAVASESYVLSDVSGASQRNGITIVDRDYGWKSAPENPKAVYIAVWAPDPYRGYIERALIGVVKANGLTPVAVENIPRYDLRGRVVLFYSPLIGKEDYMLTEERSISGILYYSYAGDAKSAVETINNGLTFSETEISRSADKFCGASTERLTKMKIANQSCATAYWFDLKAKVGKLSNDNPYEMIANEIASQLDQFLKSDESDKP
ncbi:hypothetical protein [Thermococcus sp.]